MNILILDDEYFIVKGIAEGIDWTSLGIQKQFLAYSVRQAKTILEGKEDIDIIISDIEMPRESGLDLAEWLIENNQAPVVIFLTGHESFPYAQHAIRLKVFSYIIKPVKMLELQHEISRAIVEFKRRQLTQTKHLQIEEELAYNSSDSISQIMEYIREHLFETDLNRSKIAESVPMNPDYLSYLFHKKTSVSLNSYIQNERMNMAKKLLSKTNLSVQDICAKCGFSSVSYFHRQFKKMCNDTPLQYRSKHQS
ncbi:MAG: DNA-binding response regulator [Lachnospiraceae bacterium]